MTLQIAIAIVVIAHGLGHVLGTFPSFGLKLGETHSSSSWLLADLLGDATARSIGTALWSLATNALFWSGLPFFFPTS
jgi:hypothetical protein